MKTMLLAFASVFVIALGANLTLAEIGFSSQDRTSGPSVRID